MRSSTVTTGPSPWPVRARFPHGLVHFRGVILLAPLRALLAAVPLAVVLAGCGEDVQLSRVQEAGIEVPADWSEIVTAADSDWTPEERRMLNSALYLVEASLPPDDPRRALVRVAPYVPSDRMAADEAPWPEDTLGLFSIRSGVIYLNRPQPAEVPALASLLTHELHHMERDRTSSVNRMQEVDRERIAHAREADDVGRMLELLRGRSSDRATLGALELAEAKARAVSATYTAKFELFRLVQALDKVEGLKQMPELYGLYEECIRPPQSELSTDHREELRLLDALDRSAHGTPAHGQIADALARARHAVAACASPQAKVEELRARTGRR